MTIGRSASGRGTFVTFEGPEGSGKTTQAAWLAARASRAGLSVVSTREPGGTAVGERIRSLLLDSGAAVAIGPRTDAFLFNAARAQLVAEVVEPALARGDLVVCARFADSTLAYQGAGGGLPMADLRTLGTLATRGLRPDLTILLDVAPEVGLARKSGDQRTRFEDGFDLAFHRRVRTGFLALAAAEPDRFAVVDATGGREVVSEAVLAALDRLPGLAPRLRASDPAREQERIHT
jgi:dTMP kinase